eukprot:CAMPEP_0185176590 /NCGR_PEP_ID=MMETSP1139-20130426/28535_1 /TAXON_ID=298111 /ORGANISM="Pavlova sp., Strain CCMP459" /LENGTH=86 /DNA_ID=CAMNT_0027742355 /DNA_START=21 /DNA_END=278 /DNA_ORIENTATION=+
MSISAVRLADSVLAMQRLPAGQLCAGRYAHLLCLPAQAHALQSHALARRGCSPRGAAGLTTSAHAADSRSGHGRQSGLPSQGDAAG